MKTFPTKFNCGESAFTLIKKINWEKVKEIKVEKPEEKGHFIIDTIQHRDENKNNFVGSYYFED